MHLLFLEPLNDSSMLELGSCFQFIVLVLQALSSVEKLIILNTSLYKFEALAF